MLRVKAGVITRKKLLENIKFWSHICGCIITQCSFRFISLGYNCIFHLWAFSSSQMLTDPKRPFTVSNAPHYGESKTQNI